MTALDPQYNVTRNANTDGTALTNCTWCSAVVVDTELHTQWHRSLVKDIQRAIARTARTNPRL